MLLEVTIVWRDESLEQKKYFNIASIIGHTVDDDVILLWTLTNDTTPIRIHGAKYLIVSIQTVE